VAREGRDREGGKKEGERMIRHYSFRFKKHGRAK